MDYLVFIFSQFIEYVKNYNTEILSSLYVKLDYLNEFWLTINGGIIQEKLSSLYEMSTNLVFTQLYYNMYLTIFGFVVLVVVILSIGYFIDSCDITATNHQIVQEVRRSYILPNKKEVDLSGLVRRIHQCILVNKMNSTILCIDLLRKYGNELINVPMPPHNYTAFLRTLWVGNHTLITYMLQNGADTTAKSIHGESAMYIVVYNLSRYTKPIGIPAFLNLLHSVGCDVNTPSNKGVTPLHVAAQEGSVDIVQWLLRKNANPNSKTVSNLRPIDYAKKHCKKSGVHRKVVAILENHMNSSN